MLSFSLILLRLAGAIRRSWRDLAFRTTLILVCLTVLSGTLFYRSIEGWGWIDSVYFSVATISTVGYGDLTPQSDIGNIFTIFYMLVGIGLFVALVTQLARALVVAPERAPGKNENEENVPLPRQDETS